MRGKLLHNYLCHATKSIVEDAGFQAKLEFPIELFDGTKDFVDVAAFRSGRCLGFEIETSIRNVRSNVAKARALGLPLVIVVPNRQLRQATEDLLNSHCASHEWTQIWISLIPDLAPLLAGWNSSFSLANAERKDGITNESGGRVQRESA